MRTHSPLPALPSVSTGHLRANGSPVSFGTMRFYQRNQLCVLLRIAKPVTDGQQSRGCQANKATPFSNFAHGCQLAGGCAPQKYIKRMQTVRKRARQPQTKRETSPFPTTCSSSAAELLRLGKTSGLSGLVWTQDRQSSTNGPKLVQGPNGSAEWMTT
jgi:hypothetical protein